MSKKCYLVEEIDWEDPCPNGFPSKVFLNKKRAEEYVKKKNEKVVFNEDGSAQYNPEMNASISWDIRKVDFIST
jgi:hypothetical protein